MKKRLDISVQTTLQVIMTAHLINQFVSLNGKNPIRGKLISQVKLASMSPRLEIHLDGHTTWL